MYNNKEMETAWNATHKIRGKNPEVYRRDNYGNIIYRPSYGKKTNMGWEIDHLKPKAKGGTDSLSNLQAVQWKENRIKSDTYPY